MVKVALVRVRRSVVVEGRHDFTRDLKVIINRAREGIERMSVRCRYANSREKHGLWGNRRQLIAESR